MAERWTQETAPEWNRQPGLVVVPGSAYAREMEKHEQFPSKYGQNPGNPYQYRPFPKMVYRAQKFQGQIRCMAAPPNAIEFPQVQDFMRSEQAADAFTKACQLTVQNEAELQRAFENGYRESPHEAVEYLEARESARSNAAAERHYQDRSLSDAAKAEAVA